MNNWNKDLFEKEKFLGLTFDDVLLIPGKSDVVPTDVDLETMLSTNIKLNTPLVSADMDTVTEHELAREMAKLGGIGFLWKHHDIAVQEDEVSKVKYTFNAKIDKPISIDENETLEDAAKKLEQYENRFSSLVITNSEGKVVGLLTDNESRFGSGSDKVKDLMVENPVCSFIDLDVDAAYNMMRERRIGKLILVDSEKKPTGLYCWKDVRDIVEKMNPLFNRDDNGQLRVGANVGIHDYERAERLLKRNCDVLLVGTAHGHSENVINTVKELKTRFTDYKFDIVAGNVATYEGAKDLFAAGADTVKVGIGPGSICTTRIISGAGAPQITAVYEASQAAREVGKYIIADGGITQSGDITKALVAGGNSIMLGSLLAATEESPGEEIVVKGKKYKEYRGMGSLGAMNDSKGSGEKYKQKKGDKLVPEGVEGMVPMKGSVSDVIYHLLGGLRSGMGYAGAYNIKELHEKARFRRITSAGLKESHPHDVKITKEAPNYQTGGE